MAHEYRYFAIVEKVIDGDTCVLQLDLGCSVWKREVVRLLGINTPELHGVADKTPGVAARDFLAELVLHKSVYVRTHKDKREKYGRLLVEVFPVGEKGEPLMEKAINLVMIEKGHAKPYSGVGPRT